MRGRQYRGDFHETMQWLQDRKNIQLIRERMIFRWQRLPLSPSFIYDYSVMVFERDACECFRKYADLDARGQKYSEQSIRDFLRSKNPSDLKLRHRIRPFLYVWSVDEIWRSEFEKFPDCVCWHDEE